MIAYDLICANGHRFECWFKNSQAYQQQKADGEIICPICQDNHIEMAFSSFGIKRYGDRSENLRDDRVDPQATLQMVYDYIDKHFEDVGLDFAKEALKMHFGETKKRNIKGTALPSEEKVLREEGVPFFKIPIIKRLDN
jgi:hypothetical protein